MQAAGQSDIDLASIISQVDSLKTDLKMLNAYIENALNDYKTKGSSLAIKAVFKKINACLMGLGRALMPILTSGAGRYNHDPMGTRFKPIPILQPLRELASMDSQSNEYKALLTSLLRARNRLSDELKSANEMLVDTLRII